MPERIQLSRKKGYRKPEGAVNVARPTRWGNPFVVHDSMDARLGGCEEHEYDCVPSAELAVERYRHAILFPSSGQPKVPTPDDVRTELRGKDLACWCPLTDANGNPVPCHADVLLEVANGPET